MALGAALLGNVGAPIEGILSSVRAPIDGLLSGLPGDRILSSMYTNLVPNNLGDLSLLNNLGNGAVLGKFGALPIVDQLNLSNLGNGTLLSSDLLKAPAQFVKIREQFIDAFATATKLPTDAIRSFLDVSEALADPSKKFLRPDLADFLTQRKIVELYSTLDLPALDALRKTVSQLRGLLPGSAGSTFMGRANLGLLEDVRTQLFDGVFANGPLAGLRDAANAYVSDVFPIIGQFADVDSLLEKASLDLGPALGIERYPLDSLSRLLELKMGLIADAVDFKTNVVSTLADITKELVKTTIDLIPAVKELLVKAPQIAVDVMLELVTLSFDVSNGVIDAKMAALEWVAMLPFDLIDTIVGMRPELFKDSSFPQLNILQSIWTEAQDMLNAYTSYTGFLNLTPELFPLDYFSEMSRGILARTSALVPPTLAP